MPSRNQVIGHRKIGKMPRALEYAGNPFFVDLIGPAAGYLFSTINHLSLGGRKYPGDQIENRRLPRPVRANQAQNLTSLDGESKVRNRRQASKILRKIFYG
jgi:hypothetical protein